MANATFSKTAALVARTTFMSLPGELRNHIYHLYFESTFDSQDLKSDAFPRPVQALRPAVAILTASRTISLEAAPIFWNDYVQRCHWGFGARHNDDARMLGFVNAARIYTLSLDITYQRRQLNTTNVSANLAWIVLESTFDLASNKEVVDRLREEWEVGHRTKGFVSYKVRPISLEGGELSMKYCFHAPDHSWVRIRGDLVRVDWGRIFAEVRGREESTG